MLPEHLHVMSQVSVKLRLSDRLSARQDNYGAINIDVDSGKLIYLHEISHIGADSYLPDDEADADGSIGLPQLQHCTTTLITRPS